MFSKELENLIQATLEDGILEDYEKAALVKRAEAEGVDLAELEIYINSILQRRKRELAKEQDAKQEINDQKKKEAFGRTCPNCGKQVPPLTLKCDCGYEFTNNHQISSIQILSDKIEKILEKPLPNDKINRKEEIKKRDQQIREIISVFPVPNTKEDIIDFLSTSISLANKEIGFLDKKKNYLIVVVLAAIIIPFFGLLFGIIFYSEKSFSEEKLKQAWRAKSEQVLIKGRSLRGDSQFTQQLDYYENLLREKTK